MRGLQSRGISAGREDSARQYCGMAEPRLNLAKLTLALDSVNGFLNGCADRACLSVRVPDVFGAQYWR